MPDRRRQDFAVSFILLLIWFAALGIVMFMRDDVPLYLLGLGTVVFVMLVPSMKELVVSAERYFSRDRGESSDDSG